MPTLAIYDVMKIQDFVFNSNKTKENLGASIIVQKVIEEGLKNSLPKNAYHDWKAAPYDLKIQNGSQTEAEVVYTGGGNAMVIYNDDNIAEKCTKTLSQDILKKTGGMLQISFSVEKLDENSNFQQVRSNLFQKLKQNKANKRYSFPLMGIGLTRLGDTDGLPAVDKVNNEYLSRSALLKLQAYNESDKYFEEKLRKNYNFEKEFDKLGQETGENYIAVVHIDGNNMGSTLENVLNRNEITQHQQAIPVIREFSKTLDDIFIETFKIVFEKFQDRLVTDPDFCKKYLNKDGNLIIRPIVLNGDDITFVTHGKLGITLTEHFLVELNKRSPMKLEVAGESIPVSACAGSAIVKSHFPFYRAYNLAEELCKSAKQKAKTLAQKDGKEDIGNWLDYHIVYTGVTTSLNTLRRQYYQVPGMNEAKPIEVNGNGKKAEMLYDQYNLLWRPWCVAGNVDEQYKWEQLKSIFDEFVNKNKDENNPWKRSRLKKLRNTMIKSDNDIRTLLAHYNSRGIGLPSFNGVKAVFPDNNQTPYFDALELIDFFEQL
ncbi:hypothetical protein JW960_11570 [candidate division KSB1 bacterium]|nr:hypothetical protein [candidate division KSB1 bacterium]